MNKEQLDKYHTFAKTKLGFDFKNIDLLVTAFTHRSYVNEHKKTTHAHNERLEFLGDAVLELVSSVFLYQNYHEPEGIMTSWRAALVNTEANAAAGEQLGYEPLVRLSKGEKNGSARAKHVILADCYEALIGAIYLDQGYEAASAFIHKNSLAHSDEMIASGAWRDPKSHLQKLAQHIDGHVPVYKTLVEEGPDHDKSFTIGVYIHGQLKASGVGRSKQAAEVAAAKAAIKGYRATHPEADKLA